MSNPTVDDLLVDLYKDLRKSFTSEASKKNFESIYSQTFALQPPTELMKGLTPIRKLSVLKTALQNFNTQYELSDLDNPFIHSMFKFAEKLISKIGNNKVPSAIEKKIADKPAKNTTPPAAATPSTKAEKLKKKRKLPGATKQEKIYAAIKTVSVQKDKPLMRGSHITCSSPECSYCKSLLVNVALTRCTKHTACTEQGWYPHVGEGLWRKLQRHHKPGSVFIPKEHALADDELPSYVQWLTQKNTEMQVDKTTSSRTSENSSETTTVTSKRARSVRSSYTPSIQDSNDWNVIMDEDQRSVSSSRTASLVN